MSNEIQSDAEGTVTSEINEQAVWDELKASESEPLDESREELPDESETASVEPETVEQPEVEQSTEEQEPNDIWANANTEQREALNAYQEQARKDEAYRKSNEGRIAAYQRQVEDLKAQLNAPAKAEAEEGNNNAVLDSEQWKRFNEEYPEVAGPIAQALGSLQAQNSEVNKSLSAIEEERRNSIYEQQTELLASDHPDWLEQAQSADFQPWLESEPRHVQEAFKRNANAIVDAREAGDVIARFKASQTNSGGNAQPDLNPKRKRQLESATATKSKGPAAAFGMPETGDEDSLWKQWAEYDKRHGSNY